MSDDVFSQHRLAHYDRTLQGLREDVQHLSNRLDRLIDLILPSVHRRPADSIDTLSVLIHQLIERIGLAEEEAEDDSEPAPAPAPKKRVTRSSVKRAPAKKTGSRRG
jgi:hypothetical protein